MPSGPRHYYKFDDSVFNLPITLNNADTSGIQRVEMMVEFSVLPASTADIFFGVFQLNNEQLRLRANNINDRIACDIGDAANFSADDAITINTPHLVVIDWDGVSVTRLTIDAAQTADSYTPEAQTRVDGTFVGNNRNASQSPPFVGYIWDIKFTNLAGDTVFHHWPLDDNSSTAVDIVGGANGSLVRPGNGQWEFISQQFQTREQRASMLSVAPVMVPPLPDGTIDDQDRVHLSFIYRDAFIPVFSDMAMEVEIQGYADGDGQSVAELSQDLTVNGYTSGDGQSVAELSQDLTVNGYTAGDGQSFAEFGQDLDITGYTAGDGQSVAELAQDLTINGYTSGDGTVPGIFDMAMEVTVAGFTSGDGQSIAELSQDLTINGYTAGDGIVPGVPVDLAMEVTIQGSTAGDGQSFAEFGQDLDIAGYVAGDGQSFAEFGQDLTINGYTAGDGILSPDLAMQVTINGYTSGTGIVVGFIPPAGPTIFEIPVIETIADIPSQQKIFSF